ncbi:MAG: prephenate dehydrogenase [Thermoanaerobaculia bacterium]
MSQIRSAAVIGLGLIGGSVGRDLAERAVRVVASDRNASAIDAAMRAGVVAAPLEDFSGVDAIVVAVPAGQVAGVLAAIARRGTDARVVIDTASTKASIVAAAATLPIAERFVGCHPLAGDHRSGWAASRNGLFDGARVFVCPDASTSQDALRRAEDLWHLIGAHTEQVDATAHDQRVARTSHLPHVLSTALAHAMAASGIERRELGRGGRDMTRLAASSAEMWTDICLDNAPALTAALATCGAALSRLTVALEQGNAAELRRFFEESKGWSE